MRPLGPQPARTTRDRARAREAKKLGVMSTPPSAQRGGTRSVRADGVAVAGVDQVLEYAVGGGSRVGAAAHRYVGIDRRGDHLDRAVAQQEARDAGVLGAELQAGA